MPESQPESRKQPVVAGATAEERDPGTWPPEVWAPLEAILQRSRRRAGQAVRDTFSHENRQVGAREMVDLWNGSRLKAMATVGANGTPHIAPVHAEFVNGRLRSTIYVNAVRLHDIETNPKVALTTWGANGAAVIIQGRARILPDSRRSTRPGATGSERQTVALEIDITRIYAMKGRD
jgi:hypothetical protein